MQQSEVVPILGLDEQAEIRKQVEKARDQLGSELDAVLMEAPAGKRFVVQGNRRVHDLVIAFVRARWDIEWSPYEKHCSNDQLKSCAQQLASCIARESCPPAILQLPGVACAARR